jgi:nucleotide-binding universal stress UspA family protein
LKTKALLELGRMARVAEDNGVTSRTKLSVGVPEDEILKLAEDTRVDLIAVGTFGRTGLEKLRLGSVAETCLDN